MSEKVLRISVVANGTWLYDGTVPREVRIVQQNWDRFFEEGFNDGPERLNEDGELYFVEYTPTSHSIGFFSLEEAIEEAERKVPGEIDWSDDKLGPISGPVIN